MRPIATAAFLAALAVSSHAQTSTQTPTRTTTHTTTAAAAARRRAAAQTASGASIEGLAAVGTMPAATGPAKTLYTLKYIDLKLGTGELAKPQMFYTVNYTGWTTDGKKFDSSFDHEGAEPFTFPAGARRVITGWDTGFEGMRIGGKRRLIVPYELAYGELGLAPVIPPKATLIFDIEFVAQSSTSPGPPPPSAPPAGTVPQGAHTETQPAQKPGSNPVTDPKDQTDEPSHTKPQQ